jgi:hypothetical protein
MTVRWLSEHRRLLGLTLALGLLVAVALATFGGPSAAQRTARPAPEPAAVVATRWQLTAEQAQAKQLQALTSKQSAEISSLKARLQGLRHSNRHSHHWR